MEELQAILERCALVCGTSVDHIKSEPGIRSKRSIADAKQLFVYCALHCCENYKKKKRIAAVLGVRQYQITYYRHKAEFSIRKERWFQELVARYKEQERIEQEKGQWKQSTQSQNSRE